MTNSVIGVRNIQHTNGTNAMVIDSDGTVTFSGAPPYRSGEIIEAIVGTCDGRTVTSLSGNYTLTDVTAIQNGTTTDTLINGSSITYIPPVGTKKVLYRFTFHWDNAENSGISHMKLFLEGTEIIPAYKAIAGNYVTNHHNAMSVTLEHVIVCDHSSDDQANGLLNGWTTAKNIQCKFREYSGSYECSLHKNHWRDGAGAVAPYIVHKPQLELMAIA